MKHFKTIAFVLLSMLSQAYLYAQSELFIDTSYTAEQMVMDFFNSPEVTISNVSYSGGEKGIAFFEGANTDIGIPAGILLSTGHVQFAVGPNASMQTSYANSVLLGDEDLQLISNGDIFDAAILEFDLTSSIDTLFFKYVFSSEEYPEYVCSHFNDVFGFFVSGEGFSGPFTDSAENIALVPGTTSFVAINQINSGITGSSSGGDISNCTPPNGSLSNSQYYKDNELGIHLSADGFTVPLPAPFVALPGVTYHVKLVIGDVTDKIFDSGVFIGIESLNGDSLLVPMAEIQTEVQGNTVTFENESRYATSYLWDFGDGNSSTERYPEPHTYSADGYYKVSLITQNYCCTDTTNFFVNIGNVSTTNLVNDRYKLLKNPVTEQIDLKIDSYVNGELQLYNSIGQEVMSQSFHSSNTIDVSSFDRGVYYLHLSIDDEFYIEKVIIQ